MALCFDYSRSSGSGRRLTAGDVPDPVGRHTSYTSETWDISNKARKPIKRARWIFGKQEEKIRININKKTTSGHRSTVVAPTFLSCHCWIAQLATVPVHSVSRAVDRSQCSRHSSTSRIWRSFLIRASYSSFSCCCLLRRSVSNLPSSLKRNKSRYFSF